MDQNALITREAAEALVASRDSIRPQDLALMNPESFAELKRAYYQRAIDSGFVNILIMLTRARGTPIGENQVEWVFSWPSPGIPPAYNFRSIYTTTTGIVEATVNGHIVLSNLAPGREMLLPGEWLRQIAAIVEASERESIWREQIDKGRAQIDAIADFTADV